MDTFIPKGSILYDDWEGGVSRRKNKSPNETIQEAVLLLLSITKRRLDSLHGSGFRRVRAVCCSSSRATPTPRATFRVGKGTEP